MAKRLFDSKVFRQRPLLSLTQILVLVGMAAAIVIALDLSRRAQAGQQVGIGEEALQIQIDREVTRQVELMATLEYVNSQDYVASYAREEGRMVLPGEQRVVPLLLEATPAPTPLPEGTPDPIGEAKPWQAWWRLLTDAPHPSP